MVDVVKVRLSRWGDVPHLWVRVVTRIRVRTRQEGQSQRKDTW